jgi:hypothetical protein
VLKQRGIEVIEMDLDERKQKILQAIIQDYITSAEPVGSRTIARKYNLGVSAATIRNEMFDLEMMGYLEQPHTSAGRIPSMKGYRFYVDCLLKPEKVTNDEKKFVRNLVSGQSKRCRSDISEYGKGTGQDYSQCDPGHDVAAARFPIEIHTVPAAGSPAGDHDCRHRFRAD